MPEGVASDVLKVPLLQLGLSLALQPVGSEDDGLRWIQSFLERRPPSLRKKLISDVSSSSFIKLCMTFSQHSLAPLKAPEAPF